VSQITAHVSAGNAATFRSYAASFGLDASALATLLLIRELRIGRLPDLAAADLDARGSANDKITAHKGDGAVKTQWKAHARAAGLSASKAAAIVFRAELKEQWLKRAVNEFDSS
jgi:hypothetical protein